MLPVLKTGTNQIQWIKPVLEPLCLGGIKAFKSTKLSFTRKCKAPSDSSPLLLCLYFWKHSGGCVYCVLQALTKSQFTVVCWLKNEVSITKRAMAAWKREQILQQSCQLSIIFNLQLQLINIYFVANESTHVSWRQDICLACYQPIKCPL